MKEYAKSMLIVGVALGAASVGAFSAKMAEPVSFGLFILATVTLTGAFTICVMQIGIGLGIELTSGPEPEDHDNEEHGAL